MAWSEAAKRVANAWNGAHPNEVAVFRAQTAWAGNLDPEAVGEWQRARGLRVDGMVGPETLQAANLPPVRASPADELDALADRVAAAQASAPRPASSAPASSAPAAAARTSSARARTPGVAELREAQANGANGANGAEARSPSSSSSKVWWLLALGLALAKRRR